MKKTVLIFFVLLLGSFCFETQAYTQKVQDVFGDISSDYTYLNELQSLYDKGMIGVDASRKFGPNQLLTRDDFVGVVMEVSCKKCIKPNTALDYIFQYTGKDIFYDVSENNKNFYCIAYAKENDVVKGYNTSYKCDDGTQKSGAAPFCTNNNITLEEAIAVLLRNAGLFTIYDNNQVMSAIQSGNITTDIAKDVKPKNLDGSAYTFYGYFKKAMEISYQEYDIYGNPKKYSLITPDSKGNLNPKKYISKEEFVRMAYIISKINACSLNNQNTSNSGLAGEIIVLDKDCTGDQKDCQKASIESKKSVYDFQADTVTTCQAGIKDTIWVFYNKNTYEMVTKKGKYIDNYAFPSAGNWLVKMMVSDNCGNMLSAYNELSYFPENTDENKNQIGVTIQATPLSGYGPLKVDFESQVSNCDSCKYSWKFGDGNVSASVNPSNVFLYPGIYQVELVVKDAYGNTAGATLTIDVQDASKDMLQKLKDLQSKYPDKKYLSDLIGTIEKGGDISGKISDYQNQYPNDTFLNDFHTSSNIATSDSDGDGVFDDKDKCILVVGEASNAGCPVLDQACIPGSTTVTCKTGFSCSSSGWCEPSPENNDLLSSCIYPSSGSSVFGNAICKTCPCDYQLSFLSQIRKCDIFIPAIVSPDMKEIYQKGSPYQIPYK